MTNNVVAMPNWKKNASAEDRLGELQVMARLNPERFARMLVIYEEDCTDETSKTRYIGTPMSTRELLGLIEQAKAEVFVQTRNG